MRQSGIMAGLVVSGIMAASVAGVHAQVEEQAIAISEGKTVAIEYTLTLEDKEVVDTNVGGEPLTFVHGSGGIIPGLEKAIEGMKVGEKRHVTVQPEEGYGPVIPDAMVEVETEKLPPSVRVAGATVLARGPEGQELNGEVMEVRGDVTIIDFNHPLAGKVLIFDVTVLDIK